ncbi:DUF1877 family protein [Gimesia panareensis]|uniref:Uncharacterized protein n=1 Tax=Gimesia panareensis TaxID=2527978 RepID=A0A518A869_9PLAN|nr:DUF1877 family protein [Gimesia panareensis]QDU50895.1 hypothetical protein Pan110_32560 [Gimesia panareensis]QDV18765.1 hypothetical protein Pan153_34260 [Gimesia panareensis]
MSVTNGFRQLSSETLSALKADASAFEAVCRNYDDPSYLEMDKAGYELLFILDPASVEFDNPDAETPFPGITDVLSGGTTIHEKIDLGYGPAKIVCDESLHKSIQEIDALTLEQFTEMAMGNEILPEVLMCELDESIIQDYHWPYLQSLAAFLREAIDQDLAVIRY